MHCVTFSSGGMHAGMAFCHAVPAGTRQQPLLTDSSDGSFDHLKRQFLLDLECISHGIKLHSI